MSIGEFDINWTKVGPNNSSFIQNWHLIKHGKAFSTEVAKVTLYFWLNDIKRNDCLTLIDSPNLLSTYCMGRQQAIGAIGVSVQSLPHTFVHGSQDCCAIQMEGKTESGVYKIYPFDNDTSLGIRTDSNLKNILRGYDIINCATGLL